MIGSLENNYPPRHDDDYRMRFAHRWSPDRSGPSRLPRFNNGGARLGFDGDRPRTRGGTPSGEIRDTLYPARRG